MSVERGYEVGIGVVPNEWVCNGALEFQGVYGGRVCLDGGCKVHTLHRYRRGRGLECVEGRSMWVEWRV